MKTPEEIAGEIVVEYFATQLSIHELEKWLRERIAKAITAERLAVWEHICIHHTDAEREDADIICPCCLRTRVKALEDGLRPFAESVARKRGAYSGNKSRQKWFDEMPGHWPLENISVTMTDGRRALALLADTKEGKA